MRPASAWKRGQADGFLSQPVKPTLTAPAAESYAAPSPVRDAADASVPATAVPRPPKAPSAYATTKAVGGRTAAAVLKVLPELNVASAPNVIAVPETVPDMTVPSPPALLSLYVTMKDAEETASAEMSVMETALNVASAPNVTVVPDTAPATATPKLEVSLYATLN